MCTHGINTRAAETEKKSTETKSKNVSPYYDQTMMFEFKVKDGEELGAADLRLCACQWPHSPATAHFLHLMALYLQPSAPLAPTGPTHCLHHLSPPGPAIPAGWVAHRGQ